MIKLQKDTWKKIALNECCEFQRGVTYSTKDEVDTNGIGILRANNINAENSKLNFDNLRLIRKEAKVKEIQRLRKNDVLICTASGSLDHIGKVAFAKEDTEFYAGGFMGIIRPISQDIEPSLLFNVFLSEKFTLFIQNQRAGTNIQNLKFSNLEDFEIPLPPLEEQKQIAALFQSIEKAMEQVDGQEKNLKALRKNLIDSISDKNRTISKAFNLSEWEKIKIEDVAYWYQRDIPNDRQKEESIINYLAADHIEPDEIFIDRNGILDDGKKGPTITKHFRKGDFLLSTRSVALHKAAIAHVDGVTGEKLIVIDVLPSSKIIKEFLPYVMHSTNFWNYAKVTASGSVNKFSSWNKIKLYEFYLPPKNEQKKILEVFEQLEIVLKQIKQQKATLKLLKQKLLNEILG